MRHTQNTLAEGGRRGTDGRIESLLRGRSPLTQGLDGLAKASAELAQNALLLYSELPTANIVDRIVTEADSDLLGELSRRLLLKHFTGVVRAERAKLKKDQRRELLPLFPELDRLPHRVVLPNGRRPQLAAINVTEARAWLKGLKDRHKLRVEKLRQRADDVDAQVPEEILQAEKLVSTMEKYARKNRGITAKEVAALEAQREE